jgi:hypothetical protein
LLPGWSQGELVSAVTFPVLDDRVGNATIGGVAPQNHSYIEYTVHSASVTDVTQSIHPNGTIRAAVSAVENAQSYLLYAAYARRSYARACIASSANPQDLLQNGSLAVDHFSAAGAKVSTDFLEEYILVDGIKELMQEVGLRIWEDSVEIPTLTYWTPLLPQNFEKQHGVSRTYHHCYRY